MKMDVLMRISWELIIANLLIRIDTPCQSSWLGIGFLAHPKLGCWRKIGHKEIAWASVSNKMTVFCGGTCKHQTDVTLWDFFRAGLGDPITGSSQQNPNENHCAILPHCLVAGLPSKISRQIIPGWTKPVLIRRVPTGHCVWSTSQKGTFSDLFLDPYPPKIGLQTYTLSMRYEQHMIYSLGQLSLW